MELELEKRNLHRNRWKNGVDTQITMDDDFIVPDTMDDVVRVILSSGELELEPVRIQSGKAVVWGNLCFRALCCAQKGGLESLGGRIPFEEEVNVPELAEHDSVSVRWQLDDLKVELINSRKLGIRALVTFRLSVETPEDTAIAAGLLGEAPKSPDGKGILGNQAEEFFGGGEIFGDTAGRPQIEMKKETLPVASVALRRRDTFRVKEELALAGNKPAIDRLLWTELRLTGVTARPVSGKVELSGTLSVFALYEGEGGQPLVEWTEAAVPFSGEVEAPGAGEQMIPVIRTRLIHKAVEEKPDYDGEMRELSVDAVIELDIRLYEDEEVEFLSDLYATNRELSCETAEASFDRILTRNSGKCRLSERVELKTPDRVLQVCHGTGSVKVDEAVPGDGVLTLNGILELQILYLTDDDVCPVQSVSELLPFSYEAEAPGITPESVWYLETGLDQLTVAMAGGSAAEVRAVVTLELLVLQPEKRGILEQAELLPLDRKKFRELPGIVGYLVQEGDTLWDIAKRFHTTRGSIKEINGLESEALTPGTCLILVKELGR